MPYTAPPFPNLPHPRKKPRNEGLSFTRYMVICMLLFLFVYNMVVMYRRWEEPGKPIVAEMQENREEDAEYYNTEGVSATVKIFCGTLDTLRSASRDSVKITYTYIK